MNRTISLLVLAIVATGCISPRAWAEPAKDAAEKPKTPPSLTVAVLDFDASTSANPELGRQVSEALAITLAGENGFTLVERPEMSRILKENKLNLTGLIDPKQTAQLGKLVGAKILVTGKIFLLDKQLFMTAKIVGTETSRLDGVLVKGEKDADIGDLMLKLAEKVAKHLRESGPGLVADPNPIEDPLPALKKALATRKLPKIAVRINEQQLPLAPPLHLDPAAETEIKMVLKEAGFTVIEGDDKARAEAGVTVIIDGEAFSEFGARIADLVSCSARLDIQATNRKTGDLLFADRETTRAVDLSQTVAGKSALQKAGRNIAIRILRHFDETLANKKGANDDKANPKEKKPQAGE